MNIEGPQPVAQLYEPGSSEFRYWAAADALGRALEFWAPLMKPAKHWADSETMSVRLDYAEDLNAYYERSAIEFGRYPTADGIIYLGESPDVICHEFGHAILDAIRPDLWDAKLAEVDAFHEAFADLTSFLTALQVPQNRTEILRAMPNRINHSSRISRIAEQMGRALRERRPDSADSDCLRNIANSFHYIDPDMLPPAGPASILTSQSHSFSRVFSAAVLDALAGMIEQSGSSDGSIRDTSRCVAQLLVFAARSTPPNMAHFAQVARAMLQADQNLFDGAYSLSLRTAFVRRGVLSLGDVVKLQAVTSTRRAAAGVAPIDAEPVTVEMPGQILGLGSLSVLIDVPPNTQAVGGRRMSAVSAARGGVFIPTDENHKAVQSYLSNLFSRGRVDTTAAGPAVLAIRHPFARATHKLERDNGAVRVRRLCYDL